MIDETESEPLDANAWVYEEELEGRLANEDLSGQLRLFPEDLPVGASGPSDIATFHLDSRRIATALQACTLWSQVDEDQPPFVTLGAAPGRLRIGMRRRSIFSRATLPIDNKHAKIPDGEIRFDYWLTGLEKLARKSLVFQHRIDARKHLWSIAANRLRLRIPVQHTNPDNQKPWDAVQRTHVSRIDPKALCDTLRFLYSATDPRQRRLFGTVEITDGLGCAGSPWCVAFATGSALNGLTLSVPIQDVAIVCRLLSRMPDDSTDLYRVPGFQIIQGGALELAIASPKQLLPATGALAQLAAQESVCLSYDAFQLNVRFCPMPLKNSAGRAAGCPAVAS